jgi:hypothetical protein
MPSTLSADLLKGTSERAFDSAYDPRWDDLEDMYAVEEDEEGTGAPCSHSTIMTG